MSFRRIVPFKITSMDSLGQGVSKESDRITFIPKTAPGDEGEAEIFSEKKGVAFGGVRSFSKHSSLRSTPPCIHYAQCPSCHYQHVSYETELQFKKQALERLLFRLKVPDLQVIGASKRLEYRNRIQLHYDLREKRLGMFNAKSSEILPVPDCLLGLPQIKEGLKRLYENDQWLKEAPQNQREGHVELYWFKGELKVSWNKPYADGGFTQVFEEMNLRLKSELKDWFSAKGGAGKLLDLFAGNGNLSNELGFEERLCVDSYNQLPGKDFLSQNLYAKEARERVTKALGKRNLQPTSLILDPPRSGLKDLDLWLEEFSPKLVAYISCDPHTMVRDLGVLKDYAVLKVFLIDFFPSTFHFETMVFLERKS